MRGVVIVFRLAETSLEVVWAPRLGRCIESWVFVESFSSVPKLTADDEGRTSQLAETEETTKVVFPAGEVSSST